MVVCFAVKIWRVADAGGDDTLPECLELRGFVKLDFSNGDSTYLVSKYCSIVYVIYQLKFAKTTK